MDELKKILLNIITVLILICCISGIAEAEENNTSKITGRFDFYPTVKSESTPYAYDFYRSRDSVGSITPNGFKENGVYYLSFCETAAISDWQYSYDSKTKSIIITTVDNKKLGFLLTKINVILMVKLFFWLIL